MISLTNHDSRARSRREVVMKFTQIIRNLQIQPFSSRYSLKKSRPFSFPASQPPGLPAPVPCAEPSCRSLWTWGDSPAILADQWDLDAVKISGFTDMICILYIYMILYDRILGYSNPIYDTGWYGQNRIEMKFPRTININKSCMCERERERKKKTRWNSVSQKIEAPYLSSEDWKKGCCSRLLALQVVAENEQSCGSFCTGRFNLSERYLHVFPSLCDLIMSLKKDSFP